MEKSDFVRVDRLLMLGLRYSGCGSTRGEGSGQGSASDGSALGTEFRHVEHEDGKGYGMGYAWGRGAEATGMG